MTSSSLSSEMEDEINTTPVATGHGFGVGMMMSILFECLLGFLTFCTNGICLWLMFQSPHLRSPCNIFVLNMCVADVIVGIVVPVVVAIVHMGYPRELHACIFVNCLINVVSLVSLLALTCVVVDRYITILYVTSKYHLTVRYIAWIIDVVVWVIAFLVGMVPFFGWYIEPPGGFKYCSYRAVIPLGYNVARFLLIRLPVLLLMTVLHAHVFFRFFRRNKRGKQSRLSAPDPFKPGATKNTVFVEHVNSSLVFDEKEMRLFRSLALMLALLSVSMLPLRIATVVSFMVPGTKVPLPIVNLFVLMAHMNSIINPMLYVLNQHSMRMAFRRWVKNNVPTSLGERFLDLTKREDDHTTMHRRSSAVSLRTEYSHREATTLEDEEISHAEFEEIVWNMAALEYLKDLQKDAATQNKGEDAVDFLEIDVPKVYIAKATLAVMTFPGNSRSETYDTVPLTREQSRSNLVIGPQYKLLTLAAKNGGSGSTSQQSITSQRTIPLASDSSRFDLVIGPQYKLRTLAAIEGGPSSTSQQTIPLAAETSRSDLVIGPQYKLPTLAAIEGGPSSTSQRTILLAADTSRSDLVIGPQYKLPTLVAIEGGPSSTSQQTIPLAAETSRSDLVIGPQYKLPTLAAIEGGPSSTSQQTIPLAADTSRSNLVIGP